MSRSHLTVGCSCVRLHHTLKSRLHEETVVEGTSEDGFPESQGERRYHYVEGTGGS